MTQKESEYYLHCGIKKLWHKKTLSDFTNDEESLRYVKKYLRGSKKNLSDGVGLYLWGANGTGKSHLLNCVCKELINERYKVRLFSIDELTDKFTDSWYSSEEKKELYDILQKTDFLAIDEFGKNVDKDGNPVYLPPLVKRTIESAIRYRVQMCKPVLISSNTQPKHIRNVFSEDIASLLMEAVIPICVRGDDFRAHIGNRIRRRLNDD